MTSLDKQFFMNQVEINHVVEKTRINEEDMELVIDDILSFLTGARPDFDIQARLGQNNEDVSIFNAQEITHMDDVRDLFLIALGIRNISIVLFLIGFMILLKNNPRGILKGIFYGSLIALCVIGFIGLLFSLDFDRTFTLFHQLFFSNDLWIMNPKTDLLILIVPEPFFYQLIHRMVFYTITPLILSGVGTGIVLFKKKKIN